MMQWIQFKNILGVVVVIADLLLNKYILFVHGAILVHKASCKYMKFI